MNQQFLSYATQTAFSISMSASAIAELHYMVANILETQKNKYGWPIENKNTETYLLRRGLIERSTEVGCERNWIPTRAGYILSALLEEAGFINKHHTDTTRKLSRWSPDLTRWADSVSVTSACQSHL